MLHNLKKLDRLIDIWKHAIVADRMIVRTTDEADKSEI